MATITPANIQHGLNFENALTIGRKAGLDCTPVPMIVNGTDRSFFVGDGVCGFAWIEIRPARGGLVTYLKKSKQGYYSEYERAYIFNIHDFNQSLTRKEAMAEAMAEHLRKCGYNVFANSRID
jgi:hypothetical protein